MSASPTLEFSAAQARVMQLAAQGLLRAPRRRARPADLLAAVRRMRLLQIDSIHVVARSPYLVLFSRLGAYPMDWLDQALASGALAEAWVHEACFVPAEDYLLHRHGAVHRQGHWAQRRARRLLGEQPREMARLLERVRERGPVRASDLSEGREQPPGWWSWTQEKSGLEAWFALGEVMVARRQAFQRVYDVRERVLPNVLAAAGVVETTADAASDPDALRRRMAADAVQALGITCADWIGDYHRQGRVPADTIAALVAEGTLLQASVRGWSRPALVHRGQLELARAVAAGALRATRNVLLSPFDPLVWDRTRARAVFGFDYALECYTPAARRRYGYFVLPWLCRGRLAGRVDAKAHRRERVFELKAVHLEPGERADARTAAALAQAVVECARWHGCGRVSIARCDPAALRRPLQRALRQAGFGRSG